MKKNKLSIITTIVCYTLLTICGFAIWYFGTAFVTLDVDFRKWSESSRVLVLIEGLVTAIGLIALFRLFK